jgi:hypothetical protein
VGAYVSTSPATSTFRANSKMINIVDRMNVDILVSVCKEKKRDIKQNMGLQL